MTELIAAFLMVTGAIFMTIAALGLIRMPDLLIRMHAATKAGALGAALIVTSVAVVYGEIGVTARALAAILFILLTAPVAAHVIGRAAYFVGIPLWEKTLMDELKGHYDPKTHALDSEPEAADTAGEGPSSAGE